MINIGFDTNTANEDFILDIRDKNQVIKARYAINSSDVEKNVLMSEHYIEISFEHDSFISFVRSDYFEWQGEKYIIREDYTPDQVSQNHYNYTLRFDHWTTLLQDDTFYYTNQGLQEAEWSLTSNAATHFQLLADNANRYFGVNTFNVGTIEFSEIKFLTFSKVSIWDAATQIANAYNGEWYLTGTTFHLVKKFSYGSEVELEIGVSVDNIDRSKGEDSEKYSRILALGSTRNIPANYRETTPGEAVDAIYQKRLRIPQSKGSFIDIATGLSPEQIKSAVVIFEEVYPKRIGTISSVSTVEYTDTDTDTGVVTKWNAYRYKDTGLQFKSEYLLPGVELRLVFQSGNLNGMDFALKFNPLGKPETDPESQIFEIYRNEDYGKALPNDTLKPQNGDTYILYGFNIALVSDQYVPAGEQELFEEGEKWLIENNRDKSVFECSTMLQYFEDNEMDLEIGQKVKLVNDQFESGYRSSRIQGYEKSLLYKYQATYTVGDNAKDSWRSNIEESIKELQIAGNTYQVTGGNGVYVIKQFDTTGPTDFNVYSAKASNAKYLNKQTGGTVQGDTVFQKKAKAEEFISDQFCNETFTSGQFGSGFRAWLAANGQSYAEFDNLMIRREMIVNVLTIAEIKSVGGQILLSLANMYCNGVTDGGTYWRCTFNTDNGTIPNQFAVDDQVICRKFNSQAIKYYWAKVVAVGDGYINISKSDKDGAGTPAIGDEIIQFGNRTNTARQSAILLSAYGSDAPSIKQYAGINSYDLTGKEVTVISPSGNKFKGDFIIQSTGKDVVSSIDDAVNKIKIGSVNLIIRTGEIFDRIINTSGAISEYQGSSLMADYIPVIEGDYLSFSQIKDPSQSDNYFRYAFYQSDKATLVIRKASDLVSFQEVVPADAEWLRVSYPTKNKVQVESGNKVTDWKESPVDTQNKISTAQAIASQVQSDLIITNQQVSTKVSQSDFNILGNRVSAAESSITINADNITSVVEKVNNINAERRNLIIRNNEQPNFMVGTNGLPTYLWGSNIMLDYIPVVAGSTLTFSQIKDTSQSDNYFRYAFFASDQTTLISRQASDQTIFTVTTPANSAYLRVSYPSLNKVKIELGNSATTWSLSPEDTQAQILAAQTSANNAQSTADIKNRTYYQDTQPTAPSGGFRTGDLWYMNSLVDFDGNINTDTSKNIYQLQYRWNGTTWGRINWSASRSKITQTDSSISQLVEKTGINSLGTGETLKSLIDQTPSKIELAVTSLKIGGRNILPISYLTNIANIAQNSFTIQGWARSSMSNANVKKIFKTNTKYTYSVKYTLTAVSSLAVASRLIGFNLYSSSTGSLEFASNSSLTTVGSTITVTGSFTTPANLADKELVYYSQRFTDGSTSQYGIVKVEDFIITEGDKVGTWTPAVEDTQSQIDDKTTLAEVASSLTITDNKISLASKTIELDGTTIAKSIQAGDLNIGNGNFHVGTDGKISAKGATISGLYRTADSGQRIEIDPINRSISLIDDSGTVKSIWYFDPNLRTAIEFPNFNSSGVKVSYVSIGNNGVNLAGVPLTVQGSTIHFVGLPTTKPSGTNQLWRDGDVLKVT